MFYYFFLINFRNRFFLVMNIVLPIIFMLMFGAIFGKSSTGSVVAYYSDRKIAEDGTWIKLDKIPTIDEIKKSKFDIVIVAYESKINVYYVSSISRSSLDVAIFRTKYDSSEHGKSVIKVKENKVELGKGLNELEYIMIGVLSISLLSVGMNAGVGIFSTYVRYGLFKKFMVTPVNPLVLLFSSINAQIITGLFSSFILIVLARLVFSVDLFVSLSKIPIYFVVVLSSVMVNLALGVLLSLIFKKSAQSVSSFLYTIFNFFSGVYFPLDFLPKTVRFVSYFSTPRYVHMLFQKLYGINSIGNVPFLILNILFVLSGLLAGGYAMRRFLTPSD
ncbi:MAG: ABC transporter permease [Fervidobacterium sp.]